MAAPTLPQLYRSVLRQFTINSIHPRATRSPSIPLHLRLLFDTYRSAYTPETEKRIQIDVENMVTYLKAQRVHKQLVERYNSSDGMTGEERATKSAGMVGLNMPQAFDADRPPTMEWSKVSERAAEAEAAGEAGAEADSKAGESSSGGTLQTIWGR